MIRVQEINVSLYVLGTSRGSCKYLLCSFHAALRDYSPMLRPLLMQILVGRGVEIAIVFGSSLDHAQRSSFSSIVRKCLSASRQYHTLNQFIVGRHPVFFFN